MQNFLVINIAWMVSILFLYCHFAFQPYNETVDAKQYQIVKSQIELDRVKFKSPQHENGY